MTTLSDVFDDLAHSLRVLLEANYRAHSGLLTVDRAEAVGNIESAWAGVLNAFHSLYDATEKEPDLKIDWYGTPELAAVLALRNARHHNHANKVRTIYSFYMQEATKVGSMERFVLIDFPAAEEGGDTFDLYLAWKDLSTLLSLPRGVTRLRESVASSIRDYLGSSKYTDYAEHFGLSEDRVLFNAIPLVCNAAAKIVPLIEAHVKPRSTEGETYLWLFKDMPQSLMNEPEVVCGPIAFVP